MACDPFQFTGEESDTSIPEIFQNSDSEEEFFGFTPKDIVGVNVERLHSRRDVDRFLAADKENRADPAVAKSKKRTRQPER